MPPDGKRFSSMPATKTYGNSRPLAEWTVIKVILLDASFSSSSERSTLLNREISSRKTSSVTTGRSSSLTSVTFSSASISSRISSRRSSTNTATLFSNSSTLAARACPSMDVSDLKEASRADWSASLRASTSAGSDFTRCATASIIVQNAFRCSTAAFFSPKASRPS